MSATLIADPGMFWPFATRRDVSSLTVVAPKTLQTSSVTQAARAMERDWKVAVLRKIVGQFEAGDYVGAAGLEALVEWLNGLPDTLPIPAVAVGENGSLYVEWDIADNSLHVSFHDDGAQEAYYSSAGGDEWETNEVKGLRKVDRAIDCLLAAM